MKQTFPLGHKLDEGSSEQAQDLRTCLCLAKTLLDTKRPADALALIDRMVARFPAHTELLHMRGQALQAANNGPAAFATFMSVLSIDPDHVPSICSVGEIYKAKGMLQESAAAYSRATEVAPESAVSRIALAAVLTDLGTKAKSAGALQEGMALYEKAIQQSPGYAPAYYNMGVLNSEAQQYDTALEWYHKATQLHPQYAEAHCNVGVILKERGDLEGAIAAYNRALAAAPNFSIVHGNLAIALTDLGTRIKVEGDIAKGIALYERALAHNPKYADALYNLGVAHGTLKQYEKAIFMYEFAIQHNPKCAEAYNNLGVIYKERDNVEKAMECYSAALSVKPDFPQSLNNMGVIYTAQGRAQEALTLLTAAIMASPTYAEAHNNLGVLQRDVGAIPEALASYSRCLEIMPDSRNASQNRLLALNYIYSGSDPMVCQAHADWGKRCLQLLKPLPPSSQEEQDLRPDRPLRVGYISPDLFTHSVSYFAEAPLSHHRTPSKHGAEGCVQHFVYCCTPKPDAKTARLKEGVENAGGTWRETSTLSELDLATLIQKDKVDILVELTGHTANNRLGTMAMKPAPIQVTWIGYPNSTGLETVDFRFTDEKCDPLDTQQTHVEELVRLPGCFLCYTPAIPDQPPVLPLPALSKGFVTFGSFNNLAKVTPEVLKLWARILLAVPNSRLMLKNKPFACETARNHFLSLLLAEGVESWRVDLVPLIAGTTEHLAMYSNIDISLDPFPYAGTTTTCESLFMGVPCITLAGDCHAYNVGVSLLAAVGMEKDWVASSQDHYAALAVQHSKQLDRLAVLRSCLRPRMLNSPLCDAPSFMAKVEDAYRKLWHRYVIEGRESMDLQRTARLKRQHQQLQQRQERLDLQQQQQQQLGQQQDAGMSQGTPSTGEVDSKGAQRGASSRTTESKCPAAGGRMRVLGAGVYAMEGMEAEDKPSGGTLAGSPHALQQNGVALESARQCESQDTAACGVVHGHEAAAPAAPGMHEEEDAMAARCRSLLLLDPQPRLHWEGPGSQPILQQAQQQEHTPGATRQVYGSVGLSTVDAQLPNGCKQEDCDAHETRMSWGNNEGKQHQSARSPEQQQGGVQQRSKVARQCHGQQ